MMKYFTRSTEDLGKKIQRMIQRILLLNRKILVLPAACLLLFLFILTNLSPNYVIQGNIADFPEASDHASPGLILDTPGCRVPKLDPYDKHVRHLIWHVKPYKCEGNPVFTVTLPNCTIILNETVLKQAYNASADSVNCSYRPIFRDSEQGSSRRENSIRFGETKKLQFGVPLNEEFLEMTCKFPNEKFTHFIPLVPIKPEVEERSSEALINSTLKDALNVVLIGIDSVSKLNFLRHFNKTHEFLRTTMSTFDMKGYTKVGDNTFPNLVPLLTGHFIEHYWNESVSNTLFFDNLDFIWNAYARKGYRTFYAEDSPETGTFQYLKRGFKNPPTDYYFRTLGLAIRHTKSEYCVNNQLEFDILYGYLKDFVKTMKDRLHFAFTMVSSLTHDYLNNAGYADEPTYRLLRDLWEDGVMNRSLVVIFSDHGLRFGKIRETYLGKFEERMPFMYLSLPEWFLEKHKDIARNLKENQNRLITLFDVHSTLRHLLRLTEGMSEETMPGGALSLFSRISEHRTCEMANILTHWCPCQVYRYIPKDNKTVVMASMAVVREINRQLEPFRNVCAHLEVDNISDARYGQANDMVLSFVRHVNDVVNKHVVRGKKVNALTDYLITFSTRPGGGMFESTLRHDHDAEQNAFTVFGISRINMYGDQSKCINHQVLKKFCFCKYDPAS